MGRKRKLPEDYATENVDDLKVKSGSLICKYCRIKINLTLKPSDRIREHLRSKRHERLKQKYHEDSMKQPMLEQALVTARKRKEEAMDISHEFVRAVCYSGLPFAILEGPCSC